MNRFLVLLPLLLLVNSCSLSNEEKAEWLVRETVKKALYHLKSYEAISTQVDSMLFDMAILDSIKECTLRKWRFAFL